MFGLILTGGKKTEAVGESHLLHQKSHLGWPGSNTEYPLWDFGEWAMARNLQLMQLCWITNLSRQTSLSVLAFRYRLIFLRTVLRGCAVGQNDCWHTPVPTDVWTAVLATISCSVIYFLLRFTPYLVSFFPFLLTLQKRDRKRRIDSSGRLGLADLRYWYLSARTLKWSSGSTFISVALSDMMKYGHTPREVLSVFRIHLTQVKGFWKCTPHYNFVSYFVRMWNLVADTEGGT